MSASASTSTPVSDVQHTKSNFDNDDDDDDDVFSPDAILSMLSPEARQALNAHKQQQTIQQQKEQDAEIGENFGMSQFWYTSETSTYLAKEAIALGQKHDTSIDRHFRIACVSCPSIYKAIKALNPPNVTAIVFEYDRRFSIYGDEYVYYDFNHPQDIPRQLYHTFDYVAADPPYLNVDCMSRTGETMRLLSRSSSTPRLFNTGAILATPIYRLLSLRACVWEPTHACHLMNPFYTYTNYESPNLGGWRPLDEEEDENTTKTTTTAETSISTSSTESTSTNTDTSLSATTNISSSTSTSTSSTVADTATASSPSTSLS